MSLLPLVRIWIWVSVLASAAGWILSALGQLNRGGYVAFFIFAIVACFVLRKWFGVGTKTLESVEDVPGRTHTPLNRGVNGNRKRVNWRKIRWRFGHGLPACFAVL